MAYTFRYRFQRVNFDENNEGSYELTGEPIDKVPCIVWSNDHIWAEASSYLAEKAEFKTQQSLDLDSVISESNHLKAYADFLELKELSWDLFPERMSLRPTYIFRGYLLTLRSQRKLKPSTVSNRASAIKRFYQWCIDNKLLDDDAEPFQSSVKYMSFSDQYGVRRGKTIITSDLAIPNRTVRLDAPEGGLYPLSRMDRDLLVRAAEPIVSPEFFLMLKLGFYSGLRIGTIVNISKSTLLNAFPSNSLEGFFSIGVGPKYGIKTKGDVTYYPSIPRDLLEDLIEYTRSVRRMARLKRFKERTGSDTDLLFITQAGNSYSITSNQSQVKKLKNIAPTIGLHLDNFYFHCTRSTFGTAVVLDMMEAEKNQSHILSVLMATMGHTSSSSSLRYVKFLENSSVMNDVTQKWATKWES